MLYVIILGVVIVGVIGYLWVINNSLVTLKMRVSESWSGIDVQLKRRSSLIPNLVEAVKGYAAHESTVFQQVTDARSGLMQAGSPQEKAAADNALSGTLKTLFAVAEAYPDLKANQNFLQLQSDLSDTEDKIAYARQFYNANARDFNTKTQIFPNVFLANALGYKPVEFYEAGDADRQDVHVSFASDAPTSVS
jgi:LemA protein